MIERIRRRLTVHHPENKRPSLMIRKVDGEFKVAMLHGGRQIYAMSTTEARRYAADLTMFATLAGRPGSCPGEHE